MKAVPFAVALTLVFATTGCKSNDSSTTSPSSTTTPAAASPTPTEQWSGTLAVGTTRFYSFPVLQYGTVNMTVSSLAAGGAASDVTPDITLSAGIGTPSGTTCSLTTSGTVQ